MNVTFENDAKALKTDISALVWYNELLPMIFKSVTAVFTAACIRISTFNSTKGTIIFICFLCVVFTKNEFITSPFSRASAVRQLVLLRQLGAINKLVLLTKFPRFVGAGGRINSWIIMEREIKLFFL